MFLLQPPLLCRQIRVWWEKAECHARHDNKYFHRTYGNLFFAMSCAFSSPHVFHVWARMWVCACAILAGWLPLWPPIRKKNTHKSKGHVLSLLCDDHVNIPNGFLLSFFAICSYSDRSGTVLMPCSRFCTCACQSHGCYVTGNADVNDCGYWLRLFRTYHRYSSYCWPYFVSLVWYLCEQHFVFLLFFGAVIFFFNGMAHLAKCLQV